MTVFCLSVCQAEYTVFLNSKSSVTEHLNSEHYFRKSQSQDRNRLIKGELFGNNLL
jgi:hypothetical protein